MCCRLYCDRYLLLVAMHQRICKEVGRGSKPSFQGQRYWRGVRDGTGAIALCSCHLLRDCQIHLAAGYPTSPGQGSLLHFGVCANLYKTVCSCCRIWTSHFQMQTLLRTGHPLSVHLGGFQASVVAGERIRDRSGCLCDPGWFCLCCPPRDASGCCG